MDRITGRDKDGCLTVHGDRAMGCINDTIYNAFARLEEYEETGLTPEETHKLAKAQEERRFAEPPCMPGDIVYTISGNIIFACEVLKIKVEAGLEYGRTTFIREKVMGWKGETPFEFDFCDFGKTVFLSREEAEAALKEQEG